MKNLEDILEECLNCDKKSQQILFNNFKGLYMGIAMRYVKERELAKDIVQLSFIKIFKNLPSLDSLAAFEGWSRRIVVNTALNELKKRSNREDLFVVEEDREYESSANVELSIIRKIDNKHLMDLVNSLPDGYRMVFTLYMIDGLSHKEIAEMLDISKSTSRSQLSKAKKNLNELVNSFNKEEDGKAFG